ncbi:metal-sulfur cluster assembly factor [Candidatus Roizmanbacteria bacterium]|nr:metal-sulfur cluster assembly factor [Candidatus Roizmanbacteria bacterium]
MSISEESVRTKLEEVLDPELHISIVDLGLIYNITILDKKKVKILMTLTTIGCPLFDTIEVDVKNKVAELGLKFEDIELALTFDPPWTLERMSERGKAILGI